MDETWASGAVELLWHALSHMDFDTEFDNRMAFVSVDNAVELTLRTYVSMPQRFFEEIRPSADEVRNAGRSFTLLVDLAEKIAGKKLDGVDLDKVLFFHHHRNRLYHEGVGSTPSASAAADYLAISEQLLDRLLNTKVNRDSEKLRAMRRDVLNAIEVDFKSEMKTKRSRAISAGLERLAGEGKQLGRDLKAFSETEFVLADKLHNTDRWGLEPIADEINRLRGTDKIEDPKLRANAGVSPNMLKRRLVLAGKYNPVSGKERQQRSKTPREA